MTVKQGGSRVHILVSLSPFLSSTAFLALHSLVKLPNTYVMFSQVFVRPQGKEEVGYILSGQVMSRGRGWGTCCTGPVGEGVHPVQVQPFRIRMGGRPVVGDASYCQCKAVLLLAFLHPCSACTLTSKTLTPSHCCMPYTCIPCTACTLAPLNCLCSCTLVLLSLLRPGTLALSYACTLTLLHFPHSCITCAHTPLHSYTLAPSHPLCFHIRCALTSLFSCTFALSHPYAVTSVVLLHPCSLAPLHPHTLLLSHPLRSYTLVLLHPCTLTPLFSCTLALSHPLCSHIHCALTPLFSCTLALSHPCALTSVVLLHPCSLAPLHLHTLVLSHPLSSYTLVLLHPFTLTPLCSHIRCTLLGPYSLAPLHSHTLVLLHICALTLAILHYLC